jgi:AbrB family looped-hinge helix DNA binding protein
MYNARGVPMLTATISAKGWIVIPAELRKKYELHAGDQVRLVDYGGVLAIIPTMKDPVREARGLLKGQKSLTRALLAERAKERRRER